MINLIAVKIEDGVQETQDGKLSKYFLVARDFDFEEAEAEAVTSVPDLILFWQIGRLDYKNFRDSLGYYVATIGFAQLDLEHQRIASAHFVVVASDRDTVHSIEDQVINGIVYHEQSMACRKIRLARAESEIFNRLERGNVSKIIDEVLDSENIHFKYQNMGREGVVSGDVNQGLFDYLNATANTRYAVGGAGPLGLRAKDWQPRGMTLKQLVDRVLAILGGEA